MNTDWAYYAYYVKSELSYLCTKKTTPQIAQAFGKCHLRIAISLVF